MPMQMINKWLLVSLLLLCCFPKMIYSLDGLTKEEYFRLCGNWYIIPKEKLGNDVLNKNTFGWGEGESIVNGTLEIDFINGTIYIPGLSRMPITKVEKGGDNQYTISAYFENGKFTVKYVMNFTAFDQFWLDYQGQGELHSWIGKQYHYYLIDGPKVICEKAGIITENDVRIRSKQGLDSSIIGMLKRGDEIDILARSDEESTIRENKAFWYFVIARNGLSGWVFGSYIR
jgi:hypothetical protein